MRPWMRDALESAIRCRTGAGMIRLSALSMKRPERLELHRERRRRDEDVAEHGSGEVGADRGPCGADRTPLRHQRKVQRHADRGAAYRLYQRDVRLAVVDDGYGLGDAEKD